MIPQIKISAKTMAAAELAGQACCCKAFRIFTSMGANTVFVIPACLSRIFREHQPAEQESV